MNAAPLTPITLPGDAVKRVASPATLPMKSRRALERSIRDAPETEDTMR
jgi:hypothetical protein